MPRRPQLEDAGPHFRPCPVAARTPEATTTNARQAMQRLATQATPYPAARAPPRPDPGVGANEASNAPPTRDETPRTTEQHRDSDITAPAATAPPLPTIADQLRAALAAFFRTRHQEQGDTHVPAAGRNRASPTDDTTTRSLPPPRDLGLPTCVTRDFPNLAEALAQLGGTIMECGATSVSAAGNVAYNQCFCLALAASVTAPHENHAAVAAELREQIEGAVRTARPQWKAADVIGQEIGALADFLIWGLQATPRLRGRAVAVYHEQDGTCEIFRSPHHTSRRSHIVAIWYTSPGPGRLGHYTWLRYHPSETTLGQVLTAHRGTSGQRRRVPTLVTNAVG